MNCPKCKKINACDSNYCKFCGNPIREKCPECGKMELIGRKVCKTRLDKIQAQLNAYENKKLPITEWGTIVVGALWLIFSSLTLIFFASKHIDNWEWGFIPIVVIYFLTPLIGIKLVLRKRWTIKKEFFRLHPVYADIIKKAEGKK